MKTESASAWAIPAAAALLLWPAVWNGYPIVFADTGTYLSQAINHYAGWDRPVFYSLFMLPLHLTLTVWPVVVAQALLTSWILWLVCRTLLPGFAPLGFVAAVASLSAFTWLPWIVSELMPDLFTPLLVLVVAMLTCVPEEVSPREQIALAALATLMIASQQSSLPLACALLTVLGLSFARGPSVIEALSPLRRWLQIGLPPALAVLALCSANLVAHGRFAISPFGNVFLLARVIYDGPGMDALHANCPQAHWRLCPFVGGFPSNSDDFLWTMDSPLVRAGGPKIVSAEASQIIRAALLADPLTEAAAAVSNTMEQISQFASGDGLNPWPEQVSPWIARDFPGWENREYEAARQQRGVLSVPWALAALHIAAAVGGLLCCGVMLPAAMRRDSICAGFLIAVLLAVPVSAAITGSLSAPHDRYQARIMWLPPFIGGVSAVALRRRAA